MSEFAASPPRQTSALLTGGRIAHGFFGRRGGVSTGIFDSLNCGFGSSDTREQVSENRARVAAALGIAAERLITVHQIHSPIIVPVTAPWAPPEAPRADAMVTATPGIGLGVLAADCAPVLFADREAGVIGAAHSGWRGAFDGILEATVDAMVALGARPEHIRAAIGPCITGASYEVGPEFRERFIETEAEWGRFFHPSQRAGHHFFDLPAFAVHRLGAHGVTQVEALGTCTYQQSDSYFSYRRATHRQEADYGRNLSAIALL